MSSDLMKENLKDGLSKIQAFLDGVSLNSDDRELHVKGNELEQLKKKKEEASAALNQMNAMLTPTSNGYSERACPPQWLNQSLPGSVS